MTVGGRRPSTITLRGRGNAGPRHGIALYGGTDNTVSNNLIADPIREGSGI